MAVLLLAGMSAQAQSYQVSAGPLARALAEFGRQSGLQISYSPSVAAGKRSNGVSGAAGTDDALAQLLAGTNLTYEFTGGSTVVIRDAPAAAAGGPIQAEGAIVLDTIDVSGRIGSAFGNYGPPPADPMALRLDLPPRQTPATVNTATSTLMLERGQDNIYEALDNFAGVTSQGNNSDTGSNVARSIFVRVFDIAGDGPVLINGQRVYTSGTNFRSTAALERVELLRGAAGIYYGASQPGGILNYVYKQPLDHAQYTISTRVDSLGGYGFTADATGPLDAANTLRYRAIGDFTRDQSPVDEIYEMPVSGMLALEWEPADDFRTNFTYEASKTTGVPQRNDNITLDDVFYAVPKDFFWGHTNDFVDIEQHTLLLENNWKPADWLNVRSYFAYQTIGQEHLTTRIGGRGPAIDNETDLVARTVHAGISDDMTISTGLDLSGEFDTGAFGHKWLGGYGFAYGESKGGVAQCSTGATDACAAIAPTAVNPYSFTPAEYTFRAELFNAIGTQRNGISDDTSIDHNFYLQDLITLPNEDTKILLGAGYTLASRESYAVRTDTGDVTESELSAQHITPRLAVIHDLTDTISVYGSYSQSYYPQLHINPDDTILDKPEIGEQYEVGVKSELFDGKALLTVALFQLDKKNVLRDPDDTEPDDGYRVLDGLQRARGIEVELTGAVTDWWDARLAYAYINTEIVKSDTNQGARFAYVSDHSVSLWNQFKVWGTPEDLGQFSLGAGLTAYSDYDDSSGNRMDPYAIVDVGLFYERRFEDTGALFKGGVRVDNLFDTVYYDRRSSSSSVTYGDPRKFSVFMSSTF